MTAIVCKSFNGLKPSLDSLLLDNADAQVANNVLLNSGTVRSLNATSQLQPAHKAGPYTIFRYDPDNNAAEGLYWLEFANDTDVMRSPIAQDQYKRLYWADGIRPPQYAIFDQIIATQSDGSYPGGSYQLGVPKPTVAPVVSGFTEVTDVVTVGRSYCLTFWNGTKESPPGTAFTVQAVDGESVKFTNITTDNRGDSSITEKRLYRKIPDPSPATTKQYRRIASIPLDESEYEDKTTDAAAADFPLLPLSNAPHPPQYPPIVSADDAKSASTLGRSYTYTLADFTDNGIKYDESPPSPKTTINADSTQTVTISGFVNPSNKAKNFRIYRQDAGQPQPLYIAMIPTSQPSYDDPIGLSKIGLPQSSLAAPISTQPPVPVTLAVNASTAGGAVNRLYMVTFVDGSANESPKSPDSEIVVVNDGVTAVAIVHSEPIPAGVTRKRLYRQDITLSSGVIVSDDNNWKMVAENTASATSATDILATSALPGVSYPTALHGLPPVPVGKPTTNANVPAAVVPESRVYCFTYVTAYGEEGPPSDSSEVVSVDPANPVSVSLPGGPPGGAYNITIKRVYRSATGTQRTKFQYVGECPVSTTSFSDTKKTAELSELLMSEGWIPPPATLRGLRLMANGSAVGFAGNSLYFSEPNLPHAWPHEYPINEQIIAIGVFGQSVAVLTNTYPYLFQGIDPGAMASVKLELPQACVSKRSMVETGDGVIYASPDGLVQIGTGTGLVTQKMMSRAQWQSYNPKSMQCFLYNGRILVIYYNGAWGMLIFDLTGASAMMTTSDVNAVNIFTAGYYAPQNDTLYFAAKGVALTNIVRFDQGSALTYRWKSKKFRLPKHDNLGFAQVICKSYASATLFVYADGVQKFMKILTGPEEFRLPGGFLALDWEFDMIGTGELTEVFLASSAAELQSA